VVLAEDAHMWRFALLVAIPACLEHHECLTPQALAPALNLIDPTTLQCQTFTDSSCDSACGPCPAVAAPAPPSWGSCDSTCRTLDETSCRITAGCRVARKAPQLGAPSTYVGCYPTDTSIAASVPCGGLGAWECSRHDDCEATYVVNTTTAPTSWLFQTCEPELFPGQ
jgi:hypothetical protein